MSLLEEPGKSCWDELLHDVRDGCYNLIYVSPPSATFSRSALAGSSARAPLRDERWPEGYPWLRGKPLKQADAGTRAVRQALDLVRAASMLHIPWLWEHPEHLGTTAGGMPASVWTWPELRKFFDQVQAGTVALVQCSFGASSREPTRLTGTWHGLGTLGHQAGPFWTAMDTIEALYLDVAAIDIRRRWTRPLCLRRYAGPLPCWHGIQPVLLRPRLGGRLGGP